LVCNFSPFSTVTLLLFQGEVEGGEKDFPPLWNESRLPYTSSLFTFLSFSYTFCFMFWSSRILRYHIPCTPLVLPCMSCCLSSELSTPLLSISLPLLCRRAERRKWLVLFAMWWIRATGSLCFRNFHSRGDAQTTKELFPGQITWGQELPANHCMEQRQGLGEWSAIQKDEEVHWGRAFLVLGTW
jgi:hypothetical protein